MVQSGGGDLFIYMLEGISCSFVKHCVKPV